MIMPTTINELCTVALQENLYVKLIQQLNKDLLYANIEESFEVSTRPEVLQRELHGVVYNLIHGSFSHYLNLLYIIDVPETKVKKLDGSDIVQLAKDVVLLILQREWQKVWFKNKL